MEIGKNLRAASALALAALAALGADRALNGENSCVVKARQAVGAILETRIEPTKAETSSDSLVSPGDFYSVNPGEVARLGGYKLSKSEKGEEKYRFEQAVFMVHTKDKDCFLVNAIVWPNLKDYKLCPTSRISLAEERIITEKISDDEVDHVLQTLKKEDLIDKILADFGVVRTDDPEEPVLDKPKEF